jgi:lipopolysaccharide core galacturonosyltransferase RgtB
VSRLSEERRLEWQLLLALGAYFALHVLLRVSISASLDYDEAEQAVLSQWLLPGYTEQPPLYTWLQILFFQFFGESILAVSLLKNSLLFATYLFVLLTAREILPDRRAAVLATAALLLIPQIAWESQRDMTHTTLAVAAAAATMWQSLRLVRRPDSIGYAILGLLVGIGLLAKANYLLFLAVLLLSLATTPEGRRLFRQPAAALTLLLALGVAGSYLLWMYQHGEIVFAASHKFTPPPNTARQPALSAWPGAPYSFSLPSGSLSSWYSPGSFADALLHQRVFEKSSQAVTCWYSLRFSRQ